MDYQVDVSSADDQTTERVDDTHALLRDLTRHYLGALKVSQQLEDDKANLAQLVAQWGEDNDSLRQQLDAAEADLRTLVRRRQSDGEAWAETAKEQHKRIQALEKQLQQAKGLHSLCVDDYAAVCGDYERLYQTNMGLSKHIETLEQQISFFEEERKRLYADIHQRGKRIETLERVNKALRQDRDELLDKRNTSSPQSPDASVEHLKADKALLQTQNASLSADRFHWLDVSNRLQAENGQLRASVQEACRIGSKALYGDFHYSDYMQLQDISKSAEQ